MSHKGFQDYGNIFSFYGDRLKHNGVFNTANRIMKYARRYLLISRIIKYMSLIIAFIETSAVLVLLSTVMLVSVPIMLVSATVLSLISLIQYRDFSKIAAPQIENSEKVVFIDAQRGFNNKKSRFLQGMTADLAKGGYLVFIISHSTLRDGINAVKQIGDSRWVIKLSCFYLLKRRVLKNTDDSKMVYIS